MAIATLIPVEEYLHTSYEDGDREYVNGEVIERTLGDIDHTDLQSSASAYLRSHYKGLVWSGSKFAYR